MGLRSERCDDSKYIETTRLPASEQINSEVWAIALCAVDLVLTTTLELSSADLLNMRLGGAVRLGCIESLLDAGVVLVGPDAIAVFRSGQRQSALLRQWGGALTASPPPLCCG